MGKRSLSMVVMLILTSMSLDVISCVDDASEKSKSRTDKLPDGLGRNRSDSEEKTSDQDSMVSGNINSVISGEWQDRNDDEASPLDSVNKYKEAQKKVQDLSELIKETNVEKAAKNAYESAKEGLSKATGDLSASSRQNNSDEL